MLFHHGNSRKYAQSRFAASLKEVISLLGMGGDFLGMGELADLCFQLLVLPLFQLGFADFLILPPQHIQTLGILPCSLFLFPALLLAAVPFIVNPAVITERLLHLRQESVHQAELAGFLQEGQILVLSVYIHQESPQLLQHGQGHMAAIYQHHATSSAGQLAGDDDLPLTGIYGLTIQKGLQFCGNFLKGKHRLNPQPVTSCAYHIP